MSTASRPAQTVIDRWGGGHMLFHRALARQGYVVVSVDNRGTPAPQGRGVAQVVYGTVGVLVLEGAGGGRSARSCAAAISRRDRIAIWGWSGGGSMTLNAMFRYPDVYKVGMSVAPVPDQRLYDTIYQERYMGLPAENAEGLPRGSPIHFAEGLRGKLLIVHGTGDDNVHYQGTERLVNRLVELKQAVRHDGLSEPHAQHLGGAGYVAARLLAHRALHRRAPAGWTALMPLRPGTRLGPYEILDLAGEGGMGEVYRARDVRLGRIIADQNRRQPGRLTVLRPGRASHARRVRSPP